MTNMKAAERAAELANAVSTLKWDSRDFAKSHDGAIRAFVQFIADADAAARKARELIVDHVGPKSADGEKAAAFLSPFILPDDVDPLVEAIKDCKLATLDCIEVDVAARLRSALAVRGLEIAEIFK